MEINLLPIEILFLIFNYLDFKSQLCGKRVCRLWHHLICQMLDQQNCLLMHDTNHKRIEERCGNFSLYGLCHYINNIPMISLKSFPAYKPSKSEELVHKMIGNLTNLKVIYLCLFNVRDKQINLLLWITSSCSSNLKHLSVICRKTVSLQFSEIYSFCQKFPKLKAFQFEALELLLSAEGVNHLLKSLTKLEVLILMDSIHSYERRLIVDHLAINFKSMSQSIRILKVPGCLMQMATIQDMPPLKSLINLHICDFHDIQSVELISQKFTNLLSLTLSNSFILNHESEANQLMEFITKLSQLKKLHLFIETEYCIFNYNTFSKLKECHNLTTIQIESTTLNSECVEAICRFVPQLKKLDLTYVEFEINTELCISWIEMLRHLECLKLSTIPELKEGSVNNILKMCQKLEYLDFSRSDQLSDQTFMACVEAAKSRPQNKLKVYFPHRNKNFILSEMFSSDFDFGKTLPKNLFLKFPSVKYI